MTDINYDCATGQITESVLPRPTIAIRKQMLRSAILTRANRIARGGITVQGSTFASDPEARAELAEAALAATVAQLNSEAFTADIELLNGNVVTLTRAQTVGLAKAFRNHTAALRANARSLIQSTNAATTHAELDAIDLTVGWP